MERNLSLHEEIELFMKMKLSICKCNPCSSRKKELYYKELKEILTKYNKDYIADMLSQFGSDNNGEMAIQ